MDNRRKHARFRTAVAAELDVDGTIYTATTRDISEGGASVVTEAQLVDGSELMITLILTEDGIEAAHHDALCTRARVMWSAPTDEQETMAGLRFEALGASGARTLAQLLAALGPQE
jgi:c-di-GMP-binding flagellar brake protein YcgR